MEIDGSVLEGGGQILRMASAFSAVLGIPIHVSKIRAGRSQGGLKAQHLTGLQLLRDISDAELEGAIIKSFDIDLKPGKIKGGKLFADTQTAGSVSLLIQSALPCALFAQHPTTLSLRGGTNADMAPPIDYTIEVFRRICSKFGVHFDLTLNVRGFFPMGRGEVVLSVNPLQESIKPVTLLEPGDVVTVRGYSFVAGVLPVKMAHAMADTAVKILKDALGSEIQINIRRFKEDPSHAVGNGSSIILWAETSTGCIFGASGLGKRGIRAEDVGSSAANELVDTISSGSCVDPHLQDQIIMFMTLANGKSRVRTVQPTLHTKTAIHIAELMTKAKFTITPEPDLGTVIIECDGISAVPAV